MLREAPIIVIDAVYIFMRVTFSILLCGIQYFLTSVTASVCSNFLCQLRLFFSPLPQVNNVISKHIGKEKRNKNTLPSSSFVQRTGTELYFEKCRELRQLSPVEVQGHRHECLFVDHSVSGSATGVTDK